MTHDAGNLHKEKQVVKKRIALLRAKARNRCVLDNAAHLLWAAK